MATLSARANAVGPPLSPGVVRGSMLIRQSVIAAVFSGISPVAAATLVACLNAGLHPQVQAIGSIGASYLCVMAQLGLALCGEGRIEYRGELLDTSDVFAAAGMRPFIPDPKDGLALCRAASVAIAQAVWTACDAARVDACALTMEAFS